MKELTATILKWMALGATRLFDADFYKRCYPETVHYPGGVRLHFIRHGCRTGLMPNEFFDPAFYHEIYPDVSAGPCPAFLHYLLFGKREGRQTCRHFDVNEIAKRPGMENVPKGKRMAKALELSAERHDRALKLLQNKKRRVALIIDRSLPRYDCDAGGRSTYHYLELFLRLGFDVMFLPDDFTAYEPYAGELESRGVSLLCGERFASEWPLFLKQYGEAIDVVFLNRPDVAVKYVDVLRKETSAKRLYYGHDLHYMRLLREYEITGETIFKDQSEMFMGWEHRLWQLSDAVYYPSEDEIRIIREHDASINARAIPLFLYDHSSIEMPAEKVSFAKRRDILFVGGFAHAPNRDAMLWFCRDVMPEVIKRCPQLALHIIGGGAPDDMQELASDNIVLHGRVSEEELIRYYNTTRLVVVPLRFGAGVKGKIVEALRWRAVVMTTPVGAEGFPQIGDALSVSEPDQGFAKAMVRLYEDISRLEQQSEKGYSYFEQHFSFERAAAILNDDL